MRALIGRALLWFIEPARRAGTDRLVQELQALHGELVAMRECQERLLRNHATAASWQAGLTVAAAGGWETSDATRKALLEALGEAAPQSPRGGC